MYTSPKYISIYSLHIPASWSILVSPTLPQKRPKCMWSIAHPPPTHAQHGARFPPPHRHYRAPTRALERRQNLAQEELRVAGGTNGRVVGSAWTWYPSWQTGILSPVVLWTPGLGVLFSPWNERWTWNTPPRGLLSTNPCRCVRQSQCILDGCNSVYPGSQRLYNEWSLGDPKRKFLYFSRSTYSLWTSRVYSKNVQYLWVVTTVT